MVIKIIGNLLMIGGFLILYQYKDKRKIGDLYGGLTFLVSGFLTIQTESWLVILLGVLIGYVLRIYGFDQGYSPTTFDVPDIKIDIPSLFKLITESPFDSTPEELKEKFINEGMLSIDLDDPSETIDYDERITLSIKTNDREDCLVEILGKDENIIQLGIQVFYRKVPVLKSNLNDHFFIINKLYEEYFGIGEPIENDFGLEWFMFKKDKMLGYINKFDLEGGQISLVFRVGNGHYF